jgi:hypothetical protein
VDGHSFAVVLATAVERGQKVETIQSGGIKCAPYTLEVVTDIFAEVDGFISVAMGKENFAQTAANCDNHVQNPGITVLPGFPELAENALHKQLARFSVGSETAKHTSKSWKFLCGPLCPKIPISTLTSSNGILLKLICSCSLLFKTSFKISLLNFAIFALSVWS